MHLSSIKPNSESTGPPPSFQGEGYSDYAKLAQSDLVPVGASETQVFLDHSTTHSVAESRRGFYLGLLKMYQPLTWLDLLGVGLYGIVSTAIAKF